MQNRLLVAVFASACIVSSCSNVESSPDVDPPNDGSSQSEARYFVGGIICSTTVSLTMALPETPPSFEAMEPMQIESQTNPETSADVDCVSELDRNLPGPGVGQTGAGSLTYSNREIMLTAATADYAQSTEFDSGVSVLLLLHDGETRSLTVSASVETENETESSTRTDWGIYNATTAFSVNLTQINTEVFTGGTFNVTPLSDSSSPENANTATWVYLFLDRNSDLTISEESEVGNIVSGNINVTGESPNWSVTFDVTLEDGMSLTGAYNGAFHNLPTD